MPGRRPTIEIVVRGAQGVGKTYMIHEIMATLRQNGYACEALTSEGVVGYALGELPLSSARPFVRIVERQDPVEPRRESPPSWSTPQAGMNPPAGWQVMADSAQLRRTQAALAENALSSQQQSQLAALSWLARQALGLEIDREAPSDHAQHLNWTTPAELQARSVIDTGPVPGSRTRLGRTPRVRDTVAEHEPEDR